MMRAASSGSAGGVAARQTALRIKHRQADFRFRISGALETNFWKRAKGFSAECAEDPPLRSLRILSALSHFLSHFGGSGSILSRMRTVSE